MTYQHLYAELYDELGADIFTTKAIEHILHLLEELRFQPKTVLDLGCGTGVATRTLVERGYHVTCLDNSPHMLGVVRDKLGEEIQLIQADIREFNLASKVDLVISTMDVFNYLLAYSDLTKAFKNAYQNLEENGMFIFDMNTEENLKLWTGKRTTIRPTWSLTSEGKYDPKKRIGKITMRLTKLKNGVFEHATEEHVQRAYTELQISRALEYAGFREFNFRNYPKFLENTQYTLKLVCTARK